jgi:hypothetical protein
LKALHAVGAISAEQLAQQMELIHARKRGPYGSSEVEEGYFPTSGVQEVRVPRRVIDLGGGRKAVTSKIGYRIPDNAQIRRLPPGTAPKTYYRSGVDRPASHEVRPIPEAVRGSFRGATVDVFAIPREDLAAGMWLQGPMAAVSPRGQKIFFRGFDEVVPLLVEAGLLRRVPRTIGDYDRASAPNNPFKVIGRFPEVSDKPGEYSRFCVLSKGSVGRNLRTQMQGKTVGVRGEDRKLAEQIFEQKGIAARFVSVANPEEAAGAGKVDYAIAHVTSGTTAREHGLSWRPLLYSSTVALVHEDALKNPKVKALLNALRKSGHLAG